MEEDKLRAELRTVMALQPEPPPMASATALAAGRRAARKRFAVAGAGAGAVMAGVLAIAVLPGVWAGGSGEAGGGWDTGGPVATPTPGGPVATPTPGGSAAPDPGETKPSWPAEASGDATYDSGAHYNRGARLLQQTLTAVPAGYQAMTGKSRDDIPFRSHQAAVEYDGVGYLASVGIRKGSGAGRIIVAAHSAESKLATEPCALARQFWDMGGVCRVEQVGSAKVGLVAEAPTAQRIDQWAAYRHPDGVVVFVAQSRHVSNGESGLVPLATLPFTDKQLAALAVDARFHLE